MDYRHTMYDDSWGYQNKEELLIFGYSCKLFRDDEKAMSLENGEHLIPWMGDSNLMIDRFDVRGTLYDLTEAESKAKNPEPLTETEQKEEEICEQERYLALYHDETQEQVAYEEESKRLQVELSSDGSYYNQVGFSYANPQYEYNQVEEQDDQKQVITAEPVTYSEPVSYNPSSDEDVFIPSHEMNIPPDMEVPKTVKQNKIIIKTAKFIVTQGAQMEIVIKTKQAGNAMFSFLSFDHPLNSYYKYVVTLIRNGRYRFEDEVDSQTSPENNSQYLHPNLSQSVRPDLTPGAISSPSRPSPHCSYSKLITKIREKQKASVVIEESETPSPAAPSSPVVPIASSDNTDAKTNSVLRNGTSSERVVSLVDYPSFNQTADGSDIEDIAPAFAKKSPKGTSHDYSKIKWPPREIQMVIDKMASYIIKNGPAFEEIVKSRSDSRFEFLNKSHEYHPYYKCKIELYSEVYGDIFKNCNKNQQDVKKKKESASSRKSVDQTNKNGGSRTISFSIKSREQEVSLTSHTTFPIESSTSEEDEDMSDGEKERRKVDREQRRQARKLKEEKERKEREEFLKKERLRKEKEEEEKRKERERQAAEDESSGNEDLYDIFKYAQEMERDTSTSASASTSTSIKTKTKTKTKKAKSKPKLKPESQEEPILKQEERKKKAAAFLSKLKDTKEEKPVFGPQMPPEIEASLMQSASQSPVSSRGSSEREKPPQPLPASEPQKTQTPPPPKSPSPPGITDMLLKNFETEKPVSSREMSMSPKRSKSSGKDSVSLTTGLISGLNDYMKSKKEKKIMEEEESSTKSRSRSHKKHSRQKSEESWSPSSKRDRKKRKRSRGSSHRRKKHRSRSRSRSRGRSKSHRSYHKKKQSKHSSSSHRDKEKSRKKKHKRHRTPSSVSTLPSSESTSPSSPTTLPSESESEMEVQVIESDEKKSSRSSSVVSLPSVSSFSKTAETKKKSSDTPLEREEKYSPKVEGYTSAGDENSVSSTLSSQTLLQKSRPLFPALESSNSSEGGLAEAEKRSHFNPNTSSAMAKIAQGLRAKLNALLEKENKMT